jgi:hypothetical protein
MKKIFFLLNAVLPVLVFAQEVVRYEEINNENKKYAVLYYTMKIYNDDDYTTEFIEKMKEIEPWNRLKLIEAYKTHENNTVVYYFSGDCVFSSEKVGNIICRIKLTDTISGDPLMDELITDLYDGNYFRDDFPIDPEILVETGNDDKGEFENREKWELGKSDYLLDIFKNTFYSINDSLVNLEYIDEMRIY